MMLSNFDVAREIFINVNHYQYFAMKSAIIFITVLFSTVDLIVSAIRCYECKNSYEPSCSDPVLKTCSGGQNFCLKNTKERGDEKSIYRCLKFEDSWGPCKYSDHVCNVCEYDGCNKPGKNGKEHKLRRCYQCYDSAKPAPEIFSMIKASCENPSKVYCGVDQQCMWATGLGQDKDVYYGCTVLPPIEMCNKYKFNDCRTCDGDLCNVPKGFIELAYHTCYECYTGDTASEANKYFRGMATCDNPSKAKCHFPRTCVRGVDKIARRKYYGCFNDEDKTSCEKFNFKACSYCDTDLCNEIRDYPSDDLVECYECYSGKKNEQLENLASCSYPAIKLCHLGFKCLRATDIEKTIYHSCVEKYVNDVSGFVNVTFCELDLCNKVPEDEISLQSYNCYECYSGDTYANMKNMPPCSKPSLKQCEPGFKCLEASSKDKTQRYFGCADGNKSCKELSGLDECQFCEENECNKIKPIDKRKRVICYDCYTLAEGEYQGTTSEDYNYALRHKPNCSNAAIIRCPLGKQCASVYKTYGGRFHGCVSDPKLDCINYGFSECDYYCREDLCNTVDAAENEANVTVTGPIQIKSSASAMSNSCLLIILIVFRTALYMHKS